MRTRNLLGIVFLVFIITGMTFASDLPGVKASATVLINAETGEVLFSKNPKAIMAPASTTKIMTAILAIEKGDLDKKVKVSKRAAATPGSSMYLHNGEVQTLRSLLYGLMLASGNDSATAIAEYMAGSEYKFAQLMTKKAKELGMRNTKYANASGLPAKGHYTTAYDMGLLARYCLKNETFAEIVQTKVASVPSSRASVNRTLTNHNKLLWQYPYTTGIKTGYTRKAGRCLVASASQNGVTLISIVLKSNSMYNDSIQLFNYGFDKLAPAPPITEQVDKSLENANELKALPAGIDQPAEPSRTEQPIVPYQSLEEF